MIDYIDVPPLRQGLTTADYTRSPSGRLDVEHEATSSSLRIVLPARDSRRLKGTFVLSTGVEM